jgi:NAD(P)H-hydrate repair Nnr-like enzyme with NAD(P)H-hydrate epimerase domain
MNDLIKTCLVNEIKVQYFVDDDGNHIDVESILNSPFDLIVDALFGFSFKGPVKEPYNKILEIFLKH